MAVRVTVPSCCLSAVTTQDPGKGRDGSFWTSMPRSPDASTGTLIDHASYQVGNGVDARESGQYDKGMQGRLTER